MIVIIDYGMGNLRSVLKAFKRINAEVKISSDIREIEKADKLVLPGVGHFKRGMENLNNMGLTAVINKKVMQDKIPVLGICLGMQLFTNHSEEGDAEGFGWIDAQTVKFNFSENDQKFKIPHMGWNNISPVKDSALLKGMEKDDSYYFVHSYYVKCNNSEDILCTTEYGIEFVSGIQKDNISGTQFHPEKSHKAGLKIIKKFTEYR
ncbi:MAG: imidazole glycerol phosphate synthase subunit HisH [Bacteroidetes bacterium]|nr:imidazole glycerol phosphate synthase subunit HisH [Bacteroidota bacterium]